MTIDNQIGFITTTNGPKNFDDDFVRRLPNCVCVRLPDRGTSMGNLKEQLEKYECEEDFSRKIRDRVGRFCDYNN